MYNREELLKLFEERRGNQIDICNKRPHDNVAYQHLADIKLHIKKVTYSHSLNEVLYLVYKNEDYRIYGNNHSEVSKTPIFRCCENCVQSMAWWMREENSGFFKQKEIYYSIGIDDNNRELDKKIVVMAERSYADSMQDDELILNRSFYD